MSNPLRICFVCTGNICRSPMAEVMFQHMVEGSNEIERGSVLISSAGTASWHVGDPMDPRARAALDALGYGGTTFGARHVNAVVGACDVFVCLDRKHGQHLRALVGDGSAAVVQLRSYDPQGGGSLDVADPYYGTLEGFGDCATIIERSCRGLLDNLNDLRSLQRQQR